MKKIREYLIVDGYNVINSWDILKDLAKNELEEAREKLNFILGEYAAYKGIYAVIVYDAYRVKTHSKRETEAANLKVVFTKEKQTADAYIEKMMTELGPKRHLIIKVATDDMAEQQMILGKGASRISTRELWLEVKNSRVRIKDITAKKTVQKNTLENLVDEDVLEKLEKIRKDKQ